MNPTAAALLRWAEPRVPALQAVLLFVVGSAILASGLPILLWIDEDAVLPPDNPLRLATLAVLCAVELLRSRAPGVALAVGTAVACGELFHGVTLATIIVFTDLLYAATAHGSRRTSRIVLVLSGAAVLVSVMVSVVSAHDLRDVVITFLQLCGIPLIPVWWGMSVRQHREATEAERARADQLARIAELDRDAAVQAERSRMARDLHDVIAGHLSAIAIQSEAVLSMVDGDPARMRSVLRSVRENSVASLTEMQAMIRLLRSDGSDVERTAPARLRDVAQLLDSARAAGLEVDATTDVAPGLPAAVDLSAYRIVQEALTNVVKHAPGSRTEVTVGRTDETLVVEVTNERTTESSDVDGVTGWGLLNMREHAQAVGGVLVAGPHERRWRVRAELPAEVERGRA